MPRRRDEDDDIEEDDDEVEDDEDDVGDDEDEEEDDDREGGSRPRKRQKSLGAQNFLDLEAEVDAEDDEDEGDDEDIRGMIADDDEDVDFDKTRAQAERAHAQRELRRERMDRPEDIERILKERGWDREDDGGDADDDYDDTEADGGGVNDLAQKSFLPTNRDPKLFMVRCKERYEHKAAISLLQKHVEMERRGMPLSITSAVAPEGLRGRLYVEAFSAEAVKTAVAGLHLISAYKVDLVPTNEMTQVLHVAPKQNHIKRGAWVRIKRGLYKGDLGQVYEEEIDENDRHVVIRLVPRIDLKSRIDDEYEDDDDDDDENEEGNRWRKKKKNFPKKPSARPPQKLFDKSEVERHFPAEVHTTMRHTSGETYYVFRGERYRYGLLYKSFPTKTLIDGDLVQPHLDEFELFRVSEQRRKADKDEEDDQGEDDDDDALNLSSVINQRRVTFFKGDSVQYVASDLKGLQGKVVSVDGETILVKVDGNDEPLAALRSDIVKSFAPGAHVRLAGGRHAGETGHVVEVKGDVVTIVSDASKEEVRALSTDVVESTELSAMPTGDNRSKYVLFDLVGLNSDPKTRGVVVKVQRDTVSILDSSNRIQNVTEKDIRTKYVDKRVSAHDRDRAPIIPGLTVRVLGGPNAQRQGIVKHIAADTIFFQAQDEMKNCGILAVMANNCVVLGQRKMTGNYADGGRNRLGGSLGGVADKFNSLSGMGRPGAVGGSSLGMAMEGGRGRRTGRRDELVGQEVSIKRGNHKGYRGRVVDANEFTVKVELNGRSKTVSVARDIIGAVGGGSLPQPGFGSLSSSRPPPGQSTAWGSARPPGPRFDGSRTPRYDAPGGRTPGWDPPGSRTPRYDYPGSRTPRHDAPGSRTPRVDPTRTPMHNAPTTPYLDPSRTPNVHDTWRPTTPAHTGGSYDAFRDSWAPDGPQNPRSPYPQAHTPHTPIEPQTPGPGGMPRTPGPGDARTPGGEARTPYTPMNDDYPSTPYEPGTPYEPRTPMTPGVDSGAGGGDGASETRANHMVNIEVRVASHGNSEGHVVSVASDGSGFSVMLKNGETVNVPEKDVTTVPPERMDRVRFLEGENAGQTGSLIGADDEGEGIVKLDLTADLLIPRLSWLGKLHSSD